MIDIINEEERQFLTTLGRGRKVFERTVKNLPSGTGVIPGTSWHGIACVSALHVHVSVTCAGLTHLRCNCMEAVRHLWISSGIDTLDGRREEAICRHGGL